MTLADYLRRAAQEPLQWSVADCCTFGADWFVARGHPDPMAAWRGRYDSMAGALRFIVNGGGLAALCAEGFRSIGLEPHAMPLAAGDVGVVLRETEDGTHEVVGIYGGERWVTRGLRGLEAGPADHVKVWRP